MTKAELVSGLQALWTWATFETISREDCGKIATLCDAALEMLEAQEPVEARLNLCDSCTKEFAECGTGKDDLVFGCGVGNDNIIGCLRYTNRWKAQEPRVMALEELPGWDGAFLVESRRKGDLVWASWYAEYELYGETVTRMVDIYGVVDDRRVKGLYGYEWRCWDRRPTEEQREAEPWN